MSDPYLIRLEYIHVSDHTDTKLFLMTIQQDSVYQEDVVADWDHRESPVVEERVLLLVCQYVL